MVLCVAESVSGLAESALGVGVGVGVDAGGGADAGGVGSAVAVAAGVSVAGVLCVGPGSACADVDANVSADMAADAASGVACGAWVVATDGAGALSRAMRVRRGGGGVWALLAKGSGAAIMRVCSGLTLTGLRADNWKWGEADMPSKTERWTRPTMPTSQASVRRDGLPEAVSGVVSADAMGICA